MRNEQVSSCPGFRKSSLLFLGLFFAFLLHAEEHFWGEVYLQETNELVFFQTNEHYEYPDSTVLIHKYLHPDSTLAALDRVVLQNDKLKSSFTKFFDVKELGKIEVEDKVMKMSYIENSEKKSKDFDLPENLVVGPLFDDHVQKNWRKLLRGEKVYIKLPAPNVMQIATFTFKLVDSDYGNDSQAVFKLSPASIILKLFIAPSYFVYDLKTKLLQSIHGNTILKTKKNGEYTKTSDVDIFYRYFRE